MRTLILLPCRVLSPTTLVDSRIVNQPLPRRTKSVWKRLCAVFSTPRARKDSSPDATSNSDQNVVVIAPSDSHEDILYQNISDNGGPISEAMPDSLSELQSEQLSTSSVVVSQVGPADEHPSSPSSNASDDSNSESSWDPDSESKVSQSAMQTVQKLITYF